VVRDEIRRLIERYTVMIEMEEAKKCPDCSGGYSRWRSEEDYTLCESCNGSAKRK